MTQTIDNGLRAGGSDPLVDAQNALQSAIAAASAFNSFSVLIEMFAEKLTFQQESTLKQTALETTNALEKIVAARNDALREIQSAQRNAALYRPAQHNQETVVNLQNRRGTQIPPYPG